MYRKGKRVTDLNLPAARKLLLETQFAINSKNLPVTSRHIDTLLVAIDKLTGSSEAAGDAERLRQFAAWAIRVAWRGEDIDGGDLQEKAAELGLLYPVEKVTPCHSDCQCAEVHGWGAEITCYRFTDTLDPAAEQYK